MGVWKRMRACTCVHVSVCECAHVCEHVCVLCVCKEGATDPDNRLEATSASPLLPHGPVGGGTWPPLPGDPQEEQRKTPRVGAALPPPPGGQQGGSLGAVVL